MTLPDLIRWHDPADVAFKPGDAGPRPMCAGCGHIEVGAYEPARPECRKSLEQAGILKPNDQQRAFNRAYLWGKPQP